MEIMPAIDLMGGRCVRLVQGRYDRVIHYERDPVEVATSFQKAGATWVHVVDLEGARDGCIENLPSLERIAALGLNIEFGGGVRDEASIEAALRAGAQRVIVGTRALEDWHWFRSVVHRDHFVSRIALGLDARLGKLAVRGWTTDTRRTALELAEHVSEWPLAAIVYTDIGRDGMLLGPNIEAIRNLASISTVPVVASDGVTDINDVKALVQIQLAGIVIGRALYENAIDLRSVLKLARKSETG